MALKALTTIGLFLLINSSWGQSVETGFLVEDPKQLHLKKILSQQDLVVDHVDKHGFEVFGPVGLSKWLKELNIPFSPLPEELNKSDKSEYPTLLAIENRLKKLASENPNILSLSSLGKSVEKNPIWMVKISDNASIDEVEPEVKYIANMHGNEIVGRELMLLLIEELIEKYKSGDATIRELVNNTEIFIVPTMNPDGSAKQRRGNSRWKDLNRNFPDFTTQDNQNTPNGREPETMAIMAWQTSRHFSLSANFHGGTECVNYPWDTSPEPAPLTELIKKLSLEYASEVPGMANSSRFPGGITNGNQWYEVNGGMQDWSFFWHGDLQVTIELSQNKWPSYSDIPTFYENNRSSLLKYLRRGHQGAGFILPHKELSGLVEIISTETNKSLGVFPFARGEFYKILPVGKFLFKLKFETGEASSFTMSVDSSTISKNGNYQLVSF
ncbi:MAG: DUF2817 domain-containing protein [Halobacteriovoraceae bacterium]|jgi:hypothetical protein|nr:DUF2817 domain-containing protein [Halobacteriovoraceae bacterium]MBT5095705.1 DUF2817 domain-containing protein [Halobacteriovoraceae bacterium]